MIANGRHCFFKDKEDFLAHTTSRANAYFFEDGIIEEMPDTFPITFCFADAGMSGAYGTWIQVDSIEFIEKLRAMINVLNSMIEYIVQSS